MSTNISGNRLKELRTAAGLSQVRLAEMSGVHVVNICKMETGKLRVAGKSLLRLARSLNADPYYLAGESPLKILEKN